jgi:4-hydroxybenzoate polyprenyltransferase/phosphoserine phosphatase
MSHPAEGYFKYSDSMFSGAPVTDPSASIPIVVDMDGTLIATDTLVEVGVLLLKRNPLNAVRMLGWLTHGKAWLKARVAEEATLDVAHLPYRPQVLEYLQTARAQGRRIVLATAADTRVAHQVAARLGLFDTVLASDGTLNLAGEQKRRRLVTEYGEKGFDYVGNAAPDLTVWRSARSAVVVGGSAALRRRVAEVTEHSQVIEGSEASLSDYLKALRVHHWLKNLLLFMPLAASHQINELTSLAHIVLAFCAFSLCASGVYLLNDLMDLEADRHHPHKRERPIPSGRVSLKVVLAGLPVLLSAGLGLSLVLSWAFVAVMGGYLVLNLAYSLRLKAVPILDVLVLAGLYTLRLIAGSVATAVWLSTWLLAFSMFLFMSLALVKRYAELMAMRAVEGTRAKARGYRLDDAELLAALGGGAGYLAVLVLALYINSDTGHALYDHPHVLWAVCVLLLYWISYLWLMAHRKCMDDDPLIFAVRDPVSRVLMALMALAVIIAI